MRFRHHCPIQPDSTAESRNWPGVPFVSRAASLSSTGTDVSAGLVQTRRRSRPTAAGELLGALRDDLPSGSICRQGPDPGGYRKVGTNFCTRQFLISATYTLPFESTARWCAKSTFPGVLPPLDI